MPVTALDPNTALIVIDLQRGILAAPTAHPVDDVVRQAGTLDAAFRQHALPVVLVNVDGSAPGRSGQGRNEQGRNEQGRRLTDLPPDWTDPVAELQPHPDDYFVTKQTWGAFSTTGLEARLRALGVTQVVIAGISTSAGATSTTRQAHEAGFNVTLPLDAMTDHSADAHLNSATRIFPRLGETGSTQAVLDLLAARRS